MYRYRQDVFVGKVLGLFIWSWMLCFAFAQPGRDEYEVKSAWVYNFMKYCEWPKSSFDKPSDPIVLGVLGKDPFGDKIEKTIGTNCVGERPIVVKRAKDIASLAGVHALFISGSEKGRLAELLGNVATKPVLTVSDIEQFHDTGGIISMWLQDGGVRFHVELKSAERAGLSIRSQLLKLSKPAPGMNTASQKVAQ